MNVKLLEKVRDYIAEHPDKYDQAQWCGTKCCIAGHAVALSGKYEIDYDTATVDGELIETVARRLLRLTIDQANNLFLYWPEEFDAGWVSDPAKSIPAAVGYINRFIATGGAE